jgi:hypothetical protein
MVSGLHNFPHTHLGGTIMGSKLFRSALLAVVILGGGSSSASAENAGLQIVRESLNPAAPRVGEYYTLSFTVRNNTGQSVYATGSILNVPPGDQVAGPSSMTLTIGAGQDQTFTFNIYCGVPAGTVNYNVTWAPAP